MQAVVFHDFNTGVIEDVPIPDPGPDDVLIKVERAQMSVPECQLSQGQKIRGYEKVKKTIEAGDARLFGHEFCGVIESVGSDVHRLETGDRVYPPGKLPCDVCPYCESGYRQYCQNKAEIGFDHPGGLAEYVVQPAAALSRLPEPVSAAEGAAMQPLASAVLCVHDANIQTGDVVAVVGTGVMGYNVGQLALHQGASAVYAIDIVPEKLKFADASGMIPVNARETDPVEHVRKQTNGIGADIVFESVGGDHRHGTHGSEPLAQAFQMTRIGGTIVQVGIIGGELSIQPRTIRDKMVTWVNPTMGTVNTGPNSNTGDVAAELVATGRVSINGFVSHELHGLGSFEKAIEITLDNERGLGPAQLIISE